MQKSIKRTISILLSILMIVSLFAIVPITASAATTGSFGSLTWNIDDDGTLTFSGSGAIPMEAFEKNGDVKKVIINDSVTELGAYAFLGCPNLTEVDIQNPSVSLKGAQHFATAGVTTVTLPEGMTTIPYGMFRRCGALTTVDLPSTITRIEDLAFEGSGLQSISVPEGATYESNSFQTDSLQSLTLEGSSPMTFTGGEFTFLSDAATVFIPEGSTYVYSTTTLYVKDPSNWDAQEMLEYAQEDFNERIEFGSSPEEALAEVNDLYGDYYGITEPFTVTLNEGDKCEAVFGGATIGKYVPPAPATYTVTWKNGDTVLETDENVAAGSTPTYDGETPTKAEDENYTYTFSGWKNGTNTYGKDETLPAVTADVTYTAQFDAYPKSGSFDGLNWSIDDEGTLTLSGSGAIPAEAFKSNPFIKKVIINSSVTGVGANAFADCANLADLTFDSKSPINFAGGYTYLTDKTTVNVPADSTYQYTVKVSTLATEEPAYKDVLPTLQAEFKNLVAMGYSYEKALAVVLEDYAEWVEDQTGEYPIADEFEFVLEDENRTGNLTDGQKCETVFGNANIHVIIPTYTVTWNNWNGSVLETDENVAVDSTPSYDGEVPTKAEDEQNTYEFAGWSDGETTYGLSDALPAVSGDVTYTAVFTAEPKTYTVTWKNWDGSVLETDEDVEAGSTPTYDGEDPVRPEDDENVYEFAGWDPEVSAVSGDVEYTAQFIEGEKEIINGKYYVDGILTKGAGLVKYQGDYYYIKQNGTLFKNGSLNVTEANTNGLLPASNYTFDKDGKLQLRNGVVHGKYYVDGVLTKGVGAVEFNGDIYYVKQNGSVLTDSVIVVPAAKANGLVTPGSHRFDADGKFVH